MTSSAWPGRLRRRGLPVLSELSCQEKLFRGIRRRRASSFMHDNDGFASLNKDLFTRSLLFAFIQENSHFDVSSGFIMILFS
jgi:hypothetical protein